MGNLFTAARRIQLDGLTLAAALAMAAAPALAQTPPSPTPAPAPAPIALGRPIGYTAAIELRLPRGYDGYGSFPCSAGGGTCTAAFAAWTTVPDKAQAAEILTLAGRAEGVTETSCRVGPEGALVRCRHKGITDRNVTAAVNRAMALMRVPPTVRGLATKNGIVSIAWDWRELNLGLWMNPGPTVSNAN